MTSRIRRNAASAVLLIVTVESGFFAGLCLESHYGLTHDCAWALWPVWVIGTFLLGRRLGDAR